MGELLDRGFQLELLQHFAERYPHSPSIDEDFPYRSNQLLVNLHYLSEHGLILGDWIQGSAGRAIPHRFRITAKGLDFLQNDGGLSAILGVVTVKLHDDTIRALLIDKVEKSDATPSAKTHLIAAIKSLPAEGLKSLAQKAMDAGIEHLPSAIQPLREWLGL